MKTQTALTKKMKAMITNYNAGSVATVNVDGSPAVSPKATFVIVADDCIAYGDIRSPGTTSNIKKNPKVEVVFVDVLARQAVRVRGSASIVEKSSEQGKLLLPHFQQNWGPYLDQMSFFVRISISQAEMILSPAYDVGFNEKELIQTNLNKLKQLAGD